MSCGGKCHCNKWLYMVIILKILVLLYHTGSYENASILTLWTFFFFIAWVLVTSIKSCM